MGLKVCKLIECYIFWVICFRNMKYQIMKYLVSYGFFCVLWVLTLLVSGCSGKSDNQAISDSTNTYSVYSYDSLKVKDDALEYPKGISYVRVERSEGKYKFLHDPAIIQHKNQLIAAWYNCPEVEISEESRINAKRSNDGGKTWSEVETIAHDTNNEKIYYVPAQLLSFNDNLYAFVGRMTGHDRIINTVGYKYDEVGKSWAKIGGIADLFLPNCTPQKLNNGNWIMAGRVASALGELPLIPAVVISNGEDIESPWRVVKLQEEKFNENQHPETTVIVEGAILYAFTRVNGKKYTPKLYTSNDFGESWTEISNHDFRAASSKLYAGILSTGQKYVVFNYPMSNGTDGREVLALAISAKNEQELKFSKLFKIRSSKLAGSPADSHYPCVLEYDKKLFVIYTAEFPGEKKRQCELAIIPIESLAVN